MSKYLAFKYPPLVIKNLSELAKVIQQAIDEYPDRDFKICPINWLEDNHWEVLGNTKDCYDTNIQSTKE